MPTPPLLISVAALLPLTPLLPAPTDLGDARRRLEHRRDPAGGRPPPRPSCREHAAAPLREVHAAQRPRGDPARGPPHAGGRRRRLVQGRLEGRGGRPYRICAPVRARDVPGHEARRRGQALRVSCRRPAPRTSTARRRPTAPTTSRSCRRTSSSSRCGWRATAWASCSTGPASARRSTTSATSSRTSAASASRTGRWAWCRR